MTADKRVDTIPLARFQAAIFDMDGVITQTAAVHAKAWKRMFDEYLERRAKARGDGGFEPFDIDDDYRRYVDGKPRYDGAQAFFASRGIDLPWGDGNDPPDRDTVCGLGNRKQAYFQEEVRAHGVRPYASTVTFIRALRAAGRKTGVFSASKNASGVLRAAGVLELFDDCVDGVVAEDLGLKGKPDPAMLLELARRLGAAPAATMVFEDAIAGVQAGHRGGFGLVVGVNRSGHDGALAQEGADIEITDLADLAIEPGAAAPDGVITVRRRG